MSEPERLGQIIARGHGPSPRNKKHRLDLVALNWNHIAGERLGEHSVPRRLARGTLTVAADGPAWASELSAESESLLRKTAEVLGESSVRKVRVQARPAPADDAGFEPDDEVREASAGRARLEDKVTDELEAIQGEELRGALERMLRASITSRQSRQGGR